LKGFKNIFATTCALAISLSTFTGTANAAESITAYGKVKASALNIRSEANTNSEVLGQVTEGQSVAIHWAVPGWAWVTANGVTGYISADYISEGGSGTAVVNISSGSLNLRASASTDSEVLTSIPNGQSLTVSELKSGWAKVTYNGKTGYVSSEYLSAEGSSAKSTSSNSGKKAVVKMSNGSLNLRASASTDAEVLCQIANGETLTVSETKSGWAKVTYDGKTGYVSAEYLSTDGSSAKSTSGKKAVVKMSSGSLNLRASASSDSEVLTSIPNGESLTVSETKSGWSKVTYDGKTGYVSAEYLSIEGQTPKKETAKETKKETKQETKSVASSSTTASSKGQAVVELAKQHLGKAYVYGATGPNNFDCSGLVYYVYKSMGVTLNRVADDQMSNGTAVSKDNLQPGDIVGFANSSGYVNHVGIYVGNGMMIHAPQTGDVVKYTSITSGSYARRLVGGRRIF